MWAACSTDLQHWDGWQWSSVEVPGETEYHDVRWVWVAGADDVWVAAGDTVQRRTAGSRETIATLAGAWLVAGSSSDDVWAASEFELVHYDQGTVVVPDALEVPPPYYGLLALAPNDVWVIRELGSRHWNGDSWSTYDLPTFHSWRVGMDAVSTNDVWLAAGELARWDGDSWELARQDYGFTDVWAYASENIFVLGGGYDFLHFDGQNWTPLNARNASAPWLWGRHRRTSMCPGLVVSFTTSR